MRQTSNMKVLIFPKDSNPYQELLYTKLRNQYPDSEFTYLKTSRIKFLIYPFIFLIKRLQGFEIIHIHWLEFSTTLSVPFSRFMSYYYTIICLYTLNLLRFKVVWTVHDIIPHEQQTKNDIRIARILSRIASVKIAHSSSVINEMHEYQLDTNETFVVPIGNYLGVYPDSITTKQARKKLGIKTNEFTILFFGLIKEYKGVDDLIEAYSKINSKRVRLIIAGNCREPLLNNQILNLKKSVKFDFYEGFIPDEEVATYFKACDIVCLPFKEITTSSSAQLAFSFGKPIISPRMGALIDLPDEVGFLYDSSKENALLDNLIKATSSIELDNMSEAANQYAKSLSWNKIAEKTYKVYEDVLSL